MTDGDESGLLRALAAGRGVLLLGQAYAGAAMQGVLRDVAAALHAEPAAGVRSQLLDKVDASDVPNLRRAFDLHAPSDGLVELSTIPWSLVLTSAVDSTPIEAFRRATASGRRLRLLYPGQTRGQLVKRAADSLTVVRLFGSLEEQDERYLPPLSRLALRQRQSFDVAAILHQLPSLIGPHGCLVVAGVSNGDWLDLDSLALACTDLPSGTLHWFDADAPPSEFDVLGDVLVSHVEELSEVLSRHAGSQEGRELEQARSRVIRAGARTVSATFARSGPTTLQFTPEEWRNVSQVGLVLDDDALASIPLMGPEEERNAFRSFLRRPQHVPDFDGVSRGFIFERHVAPTILERIEAALATLGSVHDVAGKKGDSARVYRSSRLPILLTGPPACGKSRLLHWLTHRLRVRGHVALYVITPAGRIHFESVERACRILESKGAQSVVVVADDLDEHSYTQLNEHLASAGRNAVIVGALSALRRSSAVDEDPRRVTESAHFASVAVPSRLTAYEVAEFNTYLADHGFSNLALAPHEVGERYFLLLLHRLLPDARGNIHLALTGEYDRLLSAIDHLRADEDVEPTGEQWRDQLQAIRRQLFPEEDLPKPESESPLAHLEGGTQAVNLCLFCAQIGKPLPLDLLLQTVGSRFLRGYREFAAVLDETGLLQEAEVDAVGTIVLDADHPVIAQLTLASVMPRRSEQILLLEPLVDGVTWDESAFPGDRPDQDYAIEVLQAVGPRGVAERDFESSAALQAIASVLARIRTDHGVSLPKLLLLEANTLRLLADRGSADHATALGRTETALEVLDKAEQILMARRATTARNSELRNVLNTRAAVHGYMIGNFLREYRNKADSEDASLRGRILDGLEEVERLAGRSRALGTASFYPLDVTFWVYRDTLEQLQDVTDEERIRFLERMEEILDSANEEPIEANQIDRYRRRAVNLAQLEGDLDLSLDLAESMRARGDFSGICLLARSEVFEPGTRVVRSRGAAEAALRRLEEYGSPAFESVEALDLMHRLWMASFIPGGQVGGADPVFVPCSADDWYRWRRILEARARISGPSQNLFMGFCLAWVLFQLDEARLASQEIRAVEPLSSGSRRRVGSLVVLTDSTGVAKRFPASVRRHEGDVLIVYVPALVSELRLPPAITTRFAVLPQVGDEVQLEVGLNYRGLLAWRVL